MLHRPFRTKKGVVEEGGAITIEMILIVAAIAIILLLIGIFGKPIAAWVGKVIGGIFGK
jgi:hypothetical protein